MRFAAKNSSHSAPPLVVIGIAHQEAVDRYRSAALGFMAGARAWSKRDLVRWLAADYRPVIVGWSEARKLTPGWGMASVRGVRTIEDGEIERVIARAHARVHERLRAIAEQPTVASGHAFIASGLVTRAVDERGVVGWAPVAQSRMLLADRVLSLFAADFLCRPWDYEDGFATCASCGSVHFGDLRCCERASGTQPIAPRHDVAAS